MRDIDALKKWLNDRALATGLGLECVELTPRSTVVDFDPPEEWDNPNGSVAGALIAALADHAAGFVALAATAPDDYVSTVDFTIHFVRPAKRKPLTCETKLIRRGRRLIFLDIVVRDRQGETVAVGQCAYAVDKGRGIEFPIGDAR